MIRKIGKIGTVIGVGLIVYGAAYDRFNPVVVGMAFIAVFIWPGFYRIGR